MIKKLKNLFKFKKKEKEKEKEKTVSENQIVKVPREELSVSPLTFDNNKLEEIGFEVGLGKAEVGETYPLFGYVSEIISEGNDAEDVIVRLNNDDIILKMKHVGGDRLEVMRDRVFETGIFIATITEITDNNGIIADCQTVIYGRKQDMGSA